MFPPIFIDTLDATVTAVVERAEDNRYLVVDLYDHNEYNAIGIALNKESAEALGRMLLAYAAELH